MAIEIQTRDSAGNPSGKVTVDEDALGGKVKPRLIHAATVMYHANMRQGSHCTKTRAEIAGTTKKLYRQKGTGRARAGNKKSGTRKGGGVIHGPKPRDYSYKMPKKQRQAALRSALLGKARDGELHVSEGINYETPKTKDFHALLNTMGIAHQTTLVATDGLKKNVYLSGRNLPGVTVVPAHELNARQILVHKNLVIERAAFDRLNQKSERSVRPRKPKGTRKATDNSADSGAENGKG
jgi:large subunit ribosomal protein L4